MNDITKPFKLIILKYAEHVRGTFDIGLYLSHPSKNGQEYDDVNWLDGLKIFPGNIIRKDIKYGLSPVIQQ